MEKFPKTYIGRYPTPMSLMRIRSSSTDKWAFIEETNTIWAQNKNGEWIDTGKAFIRTDTFKGNPLIADGTINWEMQGLKIFGKSKQASTTGEQLLKLPEQVVATRCTYTTDGTEITMDATGADAYVGTIQNVSVAVDPIRSFIVDVSGKSTIYCYIENSAFNKNYVAFLDENYIVMTGYFAVPSSRSIEVPSGYKYACFRFGVSDSVEGTRYKTKIMINAGSTVLPWEPYTGGMPSPSPEYPQDIVSTGDDGQVDLTITGANLFNPDGAYIFKSGENKSGIVVTIKDDGSLVFDGEPTNYSDFFFNTAQFKNLPKGSYTISVGSAKEKVEIYASIGGKLYAGIKKDCVFETEPGIAIGYVILRLRQSYSNYEVKINLNPGSVALPYHDYQTSQLFPIPTPNGLPGIPVDSGGNYVDETGQQWICDYVDFGKGVKVERNVKVAITSDTIPRISDMSIYNTKTFDSGFWPFRYVDNNKKLIKNSKLLSNFFECKYTSWGYTGERAWTVASYIDFNIAFSRLGVTSESTYNDVLNALKNYVNKNEIYFVAQLETPVETPLSPEELAAYQALTSYDGATNIFSDEEVGLEAELVTDKIDKDGYADPSAELSLYYAALAGFVSLSDVPMPSCRESELVRKLIDPEFELSFEVNDSSSRKEKYLWDLINGTTEMLSNNPLSNTEKFLHIMLGGKVSEYPVVHSELEYWMDVCATFYGKI